MIFTTGAHNLKPVRRYTVERWEDPQSGERGWLVLDQLTRENGGPAPVDVFPARHFARRWVQAQPVVHEVRSGTYAGRRGRIVRTVDQGHNSEIEEIVL